MDCINTTIKFSHLNKKFGWTYPFLSNDQQNNESMAVVAMRTGDDDDQRQQPSRQHYLTATQNIPIDTPICLASNNTVVFSNSRLFRKFVWRVHHEYDDNMLVVCYWVRGWLCWIIMMMW